MTREEYMQVYSSIILDRIGSNSDACLDCYGTGVKSYPNTSTWRRGSGISGQAFTRDVCNKCWGSGVHGVPWPSHQEFYDMKNRLASIDATVDKK